MRLWSAAALAFVIFLALPVPGTAQVATGTINITAADASGAMVPGAAITVTNNGTGLVADWYRQ